MKLLFTIGVLYCFMSNTIAQTITFNKRMTVGCVNSIFTGLYEADSCYYMMGMARDTINCQRSSLFAKLDYLGNITEYKITVGDETWMASFHKSLDNNFINSLSYFDSLGYVGSIQKYNNKGNVLQHISFVNPLVLGDYIVPKDMIQTRDSGYLAISAITDVIDDEQDIYITKFTTTGQLDWSDTIGFRNSLNEEFASLYHDKANEQYIIGYLQDNMQLAPNRPIIRCMLQALDHNGNILWTWGSPYFGKQVHGANDIIQTQDGGYVAVSALGGSRVVSNNSRIEYFYDPYIFKLDSARNMLWEHSFECKYAEALAFQKVVELDDSSIVVAGEFGQIYPDTLNPQYAVQQAKVVKLKTDGTILWDRDYAYLTAAYSSHRIFDMISTKDDGILICGSASGSGQGALQQGWLLKLDEHGCLVPGCHLVSGVLPPSATSSVELLLYPNPATQFLNVFYQSSQQDGELSFSIINVQGQILQQYKNTATSGKTYMLDVGELPTGNYFLEVDLDGNLMKTEQFIKQ